MKFVTRALRRILVIEDDAKTAKQIVDFLATRGYEADLAGDGDEGLRLGERCAMSIRRTVVRVSLKPSSNVALRRLLRAVCICLPTKHLHLSLGISRRGQLSSERGS